MRLITAEGGIEYGVLEESDGAAMTPLLADAFSRREPMAVAVGLSEREVERFVRAFLPKALDEQLAITEATGDASQRVFRKLGFRDLFSTSYNEFVHEGERVFASIAGVDGTVLMVRELSVR